MKKQVLFINVCLYLFLFFSCSEELDNMVGEAEVKQIDESFSETIIQPVEVPRLQSMAKLLAKITDKSQVLYEVNYAVKESMEYGMDEEWRFKDILAPQSGKILRSDNESVLAKSLRELLKKQSDNTSELRSGTLSLEEFILNENVQIYWPYSENWDGVMEPVVSFDPKNGNEWNYAYRRILLPSGEYGLDSVIIDDEYAKKNPVWIINQNHLHYDELPDFSEGESVKNNVLFLRNASTLSRNFTFVEGFPGSEGSTSTEGGRLTSQQGAGTMHVLKLGRLMASKQHDDIFNGGSEFAIKLGYCPSGINENNTEKVVSYCRITRSRGDISKKRWVDLDIILNPDWREDQKECSFKLYEEDQGNTVYWNSPIRYKDFEVTIPIPYASGDDHIYQIIYPRYFILSTANQSASGIPVVHNANGVFWTLPITKITY